MIKSAKLTHYYQPFLSNMEQNYHKEDKISYEIDLIKNDMLEEFIKITVHPKFSFDHKFFFPKLRLKISYINIAAMYGSAKIFRFLMLNCSINNSVLNFAVMGGNVEIIRLCFQSHGIHQDMKKLMETAILYHRYEIFKWLDPNAECELYPVVLLSRNYDTFLYLYENNRTKVELYLSSPNLYLEASVSFLRSFLPLFTKQSLNNFLIKSIIKRVPTEVQFLLLNGVDPNFRDDEGETPFFRAVTTSYEIISRQLLENGANPYATNLVGFTADIEAIESTFPPLNIIMLYKSLGLKLNRLFLNRCAGYKINADDFMKIISYCEDQLNERDEEGFTPLLTAAGARMTENVNILLETPGVNKEARDFYGRSYVDLVEGRLQPAVPTIN